MLLNTEDMLRSFAGELSIATDSLQFPDAPINPASIKAIMISEAPPQDPGDYFYSNSESPAYMDTTIPLFQNAGVSISGISDILSLGIYVTTAVKAPKAGYEVDKEQLKEHLPILGFELGLFPELRVIMLMGDVAKKAFNMYAKEKTGKNAIPSGSTYKIRKDEFYFENKRVFPSYIMTGGNLLIEKSKRDMISDDIRRMMTLL